MIELIKHSLGLCGDNHPNIFTIIFGASSIGTYIYYILFKLGVIHEKRNNCKE